MTFEKRRDIILIRIIYIRLSKGCIMKENTKILGFANGNQTSYKLKFFNIEEIIVSTVSGKALFDFLWIDGDMLRTSFTDLVLA